jgi:hypothetical protein
MSSVEKSKRKPPRAGRLSSALRLFGTRLDGFRFGFGPGLVGGFAAPGSRDALGGDRVEVFTAPAAVAPCVHSHRVHLLSSGDPVHSLRILLRGTGSQQI